MISFGNEGGDEKGSVVVASNSRGHRNDNTEREKEKGRGRGEEREYIRKRVMGGSNWTK